MIRFVSGDILSSQSEALVNTVNCVGVMGKGIALQFKKAFPENFKAYAAACKYGEVLPGSMFIYENKTLSSPRYIVNFPTKRHWKGKSRLEDIDAGLKSLALDIVRLDIGSIAIPPLGSGLGGLSWDVVRPLIVKHLSDFKDVEIEVFEPGYAVPNEKLDDSAAPPNLTRGRALLVALINKYLAACMDTSVNLLEIHKLLYLVQSSGENLKLRYVKAEYGPYAENLRFVLKAMENYYISGFVGDGDNPFQEISLVPGAVQEALDFISSQTDAVNTIEKVSSVIDGFETAFGLELLTSVHWLATQENLRTVPSIISGVHSWNQRKRRFPANAIEKAVIRLNETKLIS
jgi:O-acetyl-ADP-ribose deacetylase (regulator of RNase III)/uncharacterized protein YwgA